MEDPEEYYDVDDGYDDDDRADDQSTKKVAYPPRLMVDFTSLGMNALLRYAQFYQITVRDDCEKEELAAVVARHFDCTLEVEEDESIVSFMQRVRNGEKSVVRHRPPEKAKHADKKRKKSNSSSRKRQRGDPPSNANGKDAKDASAANGADAKSSAAASKAADLHDDDQPLSQVTRPQARSKPSGPPSGSSNAASSGSAAGGSSRDHASSAGEKGGSSTSKSNGSRGGKKKGENDNGEDNELYCICNLPSYGNMIACDGKKCPNPSQWYHLECVGFSDGRHPDTWLCPECDPKGFADFKSKKKKSKQRSKSPGSK